STRVCRMRGRPCIPGDAARTTASECAAKCGLDGFVRGDPLAPPSKRPVKFLERTLLALDIRDVCDALILEVEDELAEGLAGLGHLPVLVIQDLEQPFRGVVLTHARLPLPSRLIGSSRSRSKPYTVPHSAHSTHPPTTRGTQ